MPDRNITFEIKEHLGTIAKYGSGWNKELNIISWNGAAPKFDIRDWDEHHEKMSRGVTLNQWEMRKLHDLYLARNNRVAVARGRALEAERNARKEAAFQHREETIPSELTPEVREDLPEESPAEIPELNPTEIPELNPAESAAKNGVLPEEEHRGSSAARGEGLNVDAETGEVLERAETDSAEEPF